MWWQDSPVRLDWRVRFCSHWRSICVPSQSHSSVPTSIVSTWLSTVSPFTYELLQVLSHCSTVLRVATNCLPKRDSLCAIVWSFENLLSLELYVHTYSTREQENVNPNTPPWSSSHKRDGSVRHCNVLRDCKTLEKYWTARVHLPTMRNICYHLQFTAPCIVWPLSIAGLVEEGKPGARDALQLCTLLLPQTNRARIHRVLRAIHKASTNPLLHLSPTQSNHHVVRPWHK